MGVTSAVEPGGSGTFLSDKELSFSVTVLALQATTNVPRIQRYMSVVQAIAAGHSRGGILANLVSSIRSRTYESWHETCHCR
jgi:hypothetical protein